MARKDVKTMRVQAYLTDPKVIAALTRDARVGKIPLSQAAGRAIARGLQKSLPADPEDRLLRLERSLRDHMRSTARDMEITQELVAEVARLMLIRLPDHPGDHDPLLRAAAEAAFQRLLDAVAARITSGHSARHTAAWPIVSELADPRADDVSAQLSAGEPRSFHPLG